jgi:hypothetical protein
MHIFSKDNTLNHQSLVVQQCVQACYAQEGAQMEEYDRRWW